MAMTPQELFVFLNQHKLTNPMEDEWVSIKEVVKTWLDGLGYSGSYLTVSYSNDDIEIQADGGISVCLYFQNSKHNLVIITKEKSVELSDAFHIDFTY